MRSLWMKRMTAARHAGPRRPSPEPGVAAGAGAAQNPRHSSPHGPEGVPMHARQLLVACAVALPAAAALAQSAHLRPGLWEETVTTKSDNAQMNAAMEQMKQRMAQMSPEQRAAMEKAMAGHGMGMAGAPNTMRVC